ncbi:hypothetical protein [Streptomyces chartreusis]|uniref:hypothetical protein n=1 Tax=Streptomyces chartreusis TaxID=1969 RepID=UPI002F90C8C3|nr:ubiquitin-like protein Pup [Streptomyces chartreusis]WTA33333.1 ubiquitin-like protein Pup [Streptomyces chartreusis]
MSSNQDRETRTAAEDEEQAGPDPEQSSTSAASAEEASSKAADVIDAIDEVLEEFDDLTLSELGFRKGEVLDADEIDKAIADKIRGFVQKDGQ